MRDHDSRGEMGCTKAPGGIVVLPRAGRPPLRIRAELLCRVTAGEGACGARLEIWRRPSGGALAALSLVPGEPAETVQARSLDALLDALEGRAQGGPLGTVSARRGPKRSCAADALERLTARLAENRRHRAFRELLDLALLALGSAGPVAGILAPGSAVGPTLTPRPDAGQQAYMETQTR